MATKEAVRGDYVVDRRSARTNMRMAAKVHPHLLGFKQSVGTEKSVSYVPHIHHQEKKKFKKVFGGLARARPLPVGIFEREMHCRVTSQGRKCTDGFCLTLLIITMAIWVGAAAFVIPRSDWKRIVYGSDSLGRTCGEGEWEQHKLVYFPNVKNDLIALQVQQDEDDLSAADRSDPVDIYNDLTSVCVKKCPSVGEVVCLNSFLGNYSTPEQLPNASTVTQCYGGSSVNTNSTAHRNAFFMANYELCSSCWTVNLNTTNYFFHCVEQTFTIISTTRHCTFPENPEDPNDPDHLEADDDRCMVVSELATSVVQNSVMLDGFDDPVAVHLTALMQGLPGWCLDIINTYPVILGIAPIVSGVVCFLCLVSIGRSCSLSCGNNKNPADITKYCSATAFFVWTFLSLGILLLLAITGFAWLNTGLFSVDVAVELLDNSSSGLDQAISTALNGFAVNISGLELGLDLFSGSLSELSGVQVTLTENLTAWQIIAFVSLLLWFLAVGALCALQKKIKMAIKITDEASVPVRRHVGLLFLPIVASVVSVVSIVWLGYLTVMVTSVNDHFNLGNVSAALEDLINSFQTCAKEASSQGYTTGDCSDLITIPDYNIEGATYDLRIIFLVFNIVMYLWVSEINCVLSKLITAGAVSDWYWTRKSGPKQKPDPSKATKGGDGVSLKMVVLRAIGRTWRYHLGTAALGAVIVPISYPLWLIMRHIEVQLHHWERRTKCSSCMYVCITKTCLCCFTRCLKMFHRDAYSLVAMQGHSFFDSCYHVADILNAPLSQLETFKFASTVVFSTAKWTVASLCALLVYLVLYLELHVTLGFSFASSNVVPAFFGGMIGYSVAKNFFDVYDAAISTLLVCFCEDALVHNINRNDPTDKHEEVFVPQSLVFHAMTATERRNYGFYTREDVVQIQQDIDYLRRMRNNADAFDAATHVCNRHNYQIKAPMTIDKVITVLKQEAQEALAGASHQAYTSEQICSIGRVKYGVDLHKGTNLHGNGMKSSQTKTAGKDNQNKKRTKIRSYQSSDTSGDEREVETDFI